MAFIHGRFTVFKVATNDLSPFTKTSTLEMNPDIHDVTGYGKSWKNKQGGLIDGTFTASGTYDSGVTGPAKILKPLVGTTAAIIRQTEGAGSGKPNEAFSAVVGKYTETNPVDDMITWSCDFAITDAVTLTAQP